MLSQALGHLPHQFDLEVLDDNSSTVRHLHYGIERGDRARNVHERRGTERAQDRITRVGKARLILAERSLDKLVQQRASGHPAVPSAVDDSIEVVVFTSMSAARTEQGRMAGCSIIAPVYRRGSCGDELELDVADRAILGFEVADRVLLKIEHDIEIEKSDDRLRHET